MPVFEEGSSRIAVRRPRNQFNRLEEHHLISPETDPNPNPKSKSAISSLFLSKSNAFRGLGCSAGAAQQVSVPAIIRSSAEWEGKRVKKKKNPPPPQKRKKEIMRVFSENLGENSENNNNNNNNGSFNPGSCMVIQDVWCGPGIGLSADAVVGSVDCVVSRRNASGRGKIDGEKFNFRERDRERDRERERERERERASCLGRRASVNPETVSFLDTEPEPEIETETEPAFLPSRPEPEVFGSRYYRHVRHPSPDGLAEFMMLHNSFIVGGRMDRFSDWRLDIDHMSYEQLLELGERIGYVSTGLKEDEIGRCVRKLKLSIIKDLSSHIHVIPDKKCSICQEDYEGDDDLGKLECGHGFHIECIKQWLKQKNKCPVCKTEPVARG